MFGDENCKLFVPPRLCMLGVMNKKILDKMMDDQDKELEDFLKQRNNKTKTRRKSKIGTLIATVGDLTIGRSTVKRDM